MGAIMKKRMLRTCDATIRNCLWVAIAVIGNGASLTRGAEPNPVRDVLTVDEWRRLDASVDSGLRFLAGQQQADGSFPTLQVGQPAITSLSALAFLSRGHLPQEGEHGARIDRAIDYVLRSQQPDGLLFGMPVNGRAWGDRRNKTGAYNHPIAGVMLAQVYGMTQGEKSQAIGEAIKKAIEFTRAHQLRPKASRDEEGGWRYLTPTPGTDADLSVTAWQVTFLRAARNAGFEVPVEAIDSAIEYVQRTFVPETGTFGYGHGSLRNQQTRAMAGSGILLLAFGGEHDTAMARSAGKWILNHPFDRYQQVIVGSEHYHYGAYYCSQAMFQLGGDYWEKFFPSYMRLHVQSQRRDGSWPQETNRDGEYGSIYTTAMMILSLTPPYQVLPIYQR
jgi:hypothetical protein